MKRNIIVFFLFTVISLFIFIIFNIKSDDNKIPFGLLTEFNKENQSEAKNEIIKNVLISTNKTEWLKSIENYTLSIQFGNIYGKTSMEAVFIIKLNEKNSIIAVYKKEGTNFVYDCLVDTFFNIKDVQLLNLKENGKSIILVREYVDQLLGAYEFATFIRGYIYDKNSFKLILNIVEDYKAYWNELWENKIDAHWLQVKQQAKVKWENGMLPVVNVEYLQVFSQSLSINSKTIPLDEDFIIKKTKGVYEIYYWSSEWKHFILFEGYNITTGQNVAIIEDMSNNPFNIVLSTNNGYRVKNKDGSIEIIDKSKIKILNPTKETFFSI